MRNLIINSIHNDLLPLGESSSPLFIHLDEINHLIIVLTKDMKVVVYEYSLSIKAKLIQEIDVELLLASSHSELLVNLMETIDKGNNPMKFLTYKGENNEVVFALENGAIISIREGKGKVQFLSKTAGVQLIAIESSPNQEHIVAVMSNYEVFLLSYADLSVISSCQLDDGDQSDIAKNNSLCSSACISWKGSSDLFAVLYQINEGFKCLVRDLKLAVMKGPARSDNKVVFSVAEAPLDYMSPVFCFQPNGSLIAFFNSKANSIFFSEKNCLIHGKFQLHEKDAIVPQLLKWNLDLPILLFIYQKEVMTHICIFFRSNYEWTRKFHKETKKKIISAKFSDLLSTQLWLYYEDSSFQFIDFVLGYNTLLPNCNNNKNNGATFVIANDSIRFTPLGLCSMPPPMCMKECQTSGSAFCSFQNYFFSFGKGAIEVYSTDQKAFDLKAKVELKEQIDNIKQVIFVPCVKASIGVFVASFIDSKDDNECLAYISYEVEYENNSVSFGIKSFNQFTHIDFHYLSKVSHGLIFNSVLFDNSSSLNYFADSTQAPKQEHNKGFEMLISGKFQDATDEGIFSKDKDNAIVFYHTNVNHHTNDNDFFRYSYDIASRETQTTLLSISHSAKEAIINIQSGIDYNKQERIFYLTRNNRLYMDSTLLAMDVNSFSLFKHFLLFTQISNSPYSTLHVIDLTQKDFLPKSQGEALFIQKLDYKDFNMRTVERGSMIVTCSGVNVVLQLPRGNLETISPRLIILHEIKAKIQHENYEEAFQIARKHKINLNFLYDIDAASFMKNISKFVEQVSKPDYINLFINSLSPIQCEEHEILYGKSVSVNEGTDKINVICDNMRRILQEKDKSGIDYTNTILICFIKKTPPQYLDALKLVQKIKVDSKENMSKADKALAFLCWIVKAETLFDFALKTYDFELVIMCAKHTQKDPKEYLSYLSSLQELHEKDPILMKYQINMDLKCYTDALTEIAKGGAKYFEQVMELIRKYELFDLGLSLYSAPMHELQYEEIYDAKAKWLHAKKDISGSAIAFMRSKDFDMALKCYLVTGRANEVITLSTKEQLFQNLIELIDAGKMTHQNAELEKIFTFIVSSPEQLKLFTAEQLKTLLLKLIDSMLQCQMYSSAYYCTITLMKACAKHESQSVQDISQLLMTELTEQIEAGFSSFKSQITITCNTFKAKYARLLKVQQLKREKPELFSMELMGKDNEDNVSDTGSVRSRSMKSGASQASRKTKLKNPKRALKEGSPMEEENLIAILKDLKLSDEALEIMTDLVSALFLLKKTEKAIELKQAKENVVNEVNVKLKGVYSIEQLKFINDNPKLSELFPEFKAFSSLTPEVKK